MDRNKYVVQCRKMLGVSLSARRAWIEITVSLILPLSGSVALRKESVDRNTSQLIEQSHPARRSPQGERG